MEKKELIYYRLDEVDEKILALKTAVDEVLVAAFISVILFSSSG